jgi:hypothetical protein
MQKRSDCENFVDLVYFALKFWKRVNYSHFYRAVHGGSHGSRASCYLTSRLSCFIPVGNLRRDTNVHIHPSCIVGYVQSLSASSSEGQHRPSTRWYTDLPPWTWGRQRRRCPGPGNQSADSSVSISQLQHPTALGASCRTWLVSCSSFKVLWECWGPISHRAVKINLAILLVTHNEFSYISKVILA